MPGGVTDIISQGLSNIISSTPIGGVVNVIGNALGLGQSEDTSAVGYDNFLKSYNILPAYPTLQEMIDASNTGNWDAGQKKAVLNTYSQSTGTLNEGDWKGIVVNVAPIQVHWFKGSQQGGVTSSTTTSQSALQAAQAASQKTNNVFQTPLSPIQQSIWGNNSINPTTKAFNNPSSPSGGAGGNSYGSGQGGPQQGTSIPIWLWIAGGFATLLSLFGVVFALFSRRR